MKRNGIEEQYVIDDFTSKDTWRIFRIMSEFVEGFETLSKIPPAVAVFGSARVLPGSEAYRKAEAIASTLARNGYSMITKRAQRYEGRQQRSQRSRFILGWFEHRTATGTEAEHLCEQASELPLFLCSKSDVCKVLHRVRYFAWRFRHSGRTL